MTEPLDPNAPWLAATDVTLPAADEVHVWRAPLDVSPLARDRFAATLTPDERQRAARFHFQQHCDRFVAGRGALRRILGRYLGVEPAELEFAYGDKGKPALASRFAGDALQFNLSHSADLALCAVTLRCEVGVDVEQLRPMDRLETLARRYFAASEIETLECLSEDQRLIGFFNAWTRKEALLKAVGTGLSFPLRRAVVTLEPSQTAAVVSWDGDDQAAQRWWLQSLSPHPSYIGAVVAPGTDFQLKLFDYCVE